MEICKVVKINKQGDQGKDISTICPTCNRALNSHVSSTFKSGRIECCWCYTDFTFEDEDSTGKEFIDFRNIGGD